MYVRPGTWSLRQVWRFLSLWLSASWLWRFDRVVGIEENGNGGIKTKSRFDVCEDAADQRQLSWSLEGSGSRA